MDYLSNILQGILLTSTITSQSFTGKRREWLSLVSQAGFVAFNLWAGLYTWAIGSFVWALVIIRNLVRIYRPHQEFNVRWQDAPAGYRICACGRLMPASVLRRVGDEANTRAARVTSDQAYCKLGRFGGIDDRAL